MYMYMYIMYVSYVVELVERVWGRMYGVCMGIVCKEQIKRLRRNQYCMYHMGERGGVGMI